MILFQRRKVMRSYSSFTAVLILIMFTVSHAAVYSGTEVKADPESVNQVVEGGNKLAVDLYKKLTQENKGKNIFFSPVSISTALAMTYAGAKGETAKEMAEVLHFGLPQEKLHPAYKKILSLFNDPAGTDSRSYDLTVANALWGLKGYKWLDSFLNVTRKNYGAGLREVDFVKATEKARNTINTWVEKETNGKIKDLIPKDVLNPLTRLVLTNAVYFNGTWTEKFKKRNTRNQDFTVSSGTKKQVPLMHQTKHFKYTEAKGVKALEMRYKGNDLSMVVILPDTKDGFAALEQGLTKDTISSLIGKLKYERVSVTIPKFKMTSTFSLKDVLSSMGMKKAFIFGTADFSGMNGVTSGLERLYISAVIHKAFVDVNETGTEAAAATAVVMAAGCAPRRPKTFQADHPFLFLIRDMRTGSILFMGRVMDPGK